MDFSGVSGAAGWAEAASGRASALELASASGLPGPGTGLVRWLTSTFELPGPEACLMRWPASAFELPGPRAGLMWGPASTFELPGPRAGLMWGLPGPAASPVTALPEPAFYGTTLTISKFPFDGGTPGMRFSSITALRTAVISSMSALRLIVIFPANLPRTTRFSRMASLRLPPFPAPPFSLSFLPLFPALRPPDPHSFHRPVSAASP